MRKKEPTSPGSRKRKSCRGLGKSQPLASHFPSGPKRDCPGGCLPVFLPGRLPSVPSPAGTASREIMRITGGSARGIPLKAPKGRAVRPATDRMREAVFSSLGDRVCGCRFLDLFAGTGAYGLEALSRGAAGGVFVERSRSAATVLRENLAALVRSLGGGEIPAHVLCRDIVSWRPRDDERADLVFADPPYGDFDRWIPQLARKLDACVVPGGEPMLVLEAPGGAEVRLPGWHCVKTIGRGRGQPTCGFWIREGGGDQEMAGSR